MEKSSLEIHEEFAMKWETALNRLKDDQPNYYTFMHQYGKYVKGTAAGDRLPNAVELQNAATKSKGAAAGIDGWVPAELARLIAAWERRA